MTSGRANRRRGADAERAVVAWLRRHGYPDARRYLAGDGRQPGDIDAIPGVCIEVKDCASSAWPTWCRQARAEAGPHRVAVVVRRLRGAPDVGSWPCAVLTLEGGMRRLSTFASIIDEITGEPYNHAPAVARLIEGKHG